MVLVVEAGYLQPLEDAWGGRGGRALLQVLAMHHTTQGAAQPHSATRYVLWEQGTGLPRGEEETEGHTLPLGREKLE